MNLSSVSSCFFEKWALGENCHIWLSTLLTDWRTLRRKMLRPLTLLLRCSWFKTVEHWLNWLTKYRQNMKMRNGMSDGKRTITTIYVSCCNSAAAANVKTKRKLPQNCCLSDFSNGWNLMCVEVVRFGARHLWTDASFECASGFSKVETTRCFVEEQPVQAALHLLKQHVYQPSDATQRSLYTRGEMPKGQ